MSSPVPGRRSGSLRLPLFVLLLVGALLAAGILVAVELRAGRPSAGEPRCVVSSTDGDGQRQRHTLSAEQSANAALVTAEAVARGADPYAAVVALATAMQESQLVNIDYGDRDSVGLFQQRPSQGWGTPAQIMDPAYATAAFYDGLAELDYTSMSVTDAAQAVQRSAHPEAYARHEGLARAFAGSLTGATEGSLNCVLGGPEGPGDARRAADALGDAFGTAAPAPRADGDRVVVTAPGEPTGWAVAHWAVAQAETLGVAEVSFGGRSWVRADQRTTRFAPAPGWVAAEEAHPEGAPPAGDVVLVLASR
ncbi:hypothetical protein [uncultured Kocuria sp.]|uniref:hypothetical protein n=1 Tax=uncultured Kocuria sp. TaxID=259305 RepID=UPI0026226C3F|nr:hypothetical protein [uncultured Kocuria sp.]